MRKVILPNLKRLFMFENKKILITGGTGSLGTALTTSLLKTDVDTIRIFSRDELKQSQNTGLKQTFRLIALLIAFIIIIGDSSK